MSPQLSQRQKQLLYYVAEVQIADLEPVGSQKIKDRYDLDWSSATIRRELNALLKENYLEQPHTSSGRILSDRGWRFIISDLVNQILRKEEKDEPLAEKLVSYLEPKFCPNNLIDFIASKCRSLGLWYSFRDDIIFTSGLKYILKDEFLDDLNDWEAIGRDFDSLDKKLRAIKDKMDDRNIRIYLGKQNPLVSSPYFAFIGFKCEPLESIIGILSPKMTDYKNHLKLFRTLMDEIY